MISRLSVYNQYRIRQYLLSLLVILTVASCVTINIYFPAAAAEKAAEKIVDQVLNSDTPVPSGQPSQTPSKPQPDETKNSNDQSFYLSPSQRVILSITDYFIPAARAAGQANLNINSPAIRSIQSNMEKRQAKLRPFYQSGAIGFTNNGLIAIANASALSIKQRSTAKKLISAENRDRMNLYREIAKANGHPEWQTDIQKTFAKTWIRKISPGWMYQTTSGQWKKK